MNDEDPEEGLRDLVDLALKQIVNKHDVIKTDQSPARNLFLSNAIELQGNLSKI